MRNCYPGRGLLLLTAAALNQACAGDSLSNGAAVVTLRNDRACFSYPSDEVTRKNKFFLYKVFVSTNKGSAAEPGIKAWELTVEPPEQASFGSPNVPERCVEYGAAVPAKAAEGSAALPMALNTPYRVFLTIHSPEISTSSASLRTYHGDFCLIAGTAVESKRVVNASFNSKTGAYECGG